ncbi:MAG: alpha/beta hydrolase-fold protein [Microbacteriaceae bacterium]
MTHAPQTLPIDSNAVLWSASQSELERRPLLVLLHGYGSHEGDLFGLSPYLPLEPVIASVRAPIAESGGYAWFSRSNGDSGNPGSPWADAAAHGVLDWLDSLPPAASVGLFGFSQGAAMTLHLLRHAPDRFAYAVSLSGFVVAGALPGDARLAQQRIPVFWGRGTEDEVIPAEAVQRTADWLPGHADLDARIYEGLGHGIAQRELADIGAFVLPHLSR